MATQTSVLMRGRISGALRSELNNYLDHTLRITRGRVIVITTLDKIQLGVCFCSFLTVLLALIVPLFRVERFVRGKTVKCFVEVYVSISIYKRSSIYFTDIATYQLQNYTSL